MRKNIGLYKGKRTDGEGWVCGYLSTKTICVPDNVHFGYVIQKPSAGLYQNEWFEVDKDTIGEYIGVWDKNSIGIFEGDLVEYRGEVFEVKYIDGFAAFDLRSVDNMRLAPRITPNTLAYIEVIGNIHDNPELLYK